jgi:hypothetical protein
MADFSDALDGLKHGVRCQRDGWNGKGMFIDMQRPDEHSKMTKPYLYLNYPDGERVPWAPSQTDVLADDWRIYTPEN